MLMNVSNTSNKSLDGFYNDLRRKYPNTFTIATELGKGDGSIHKLPRLDRTPSPAPQGILPSPFNSGSQRWTPDSFLSKVKLQKCQNEQKQEVETFPRNGGAVIIRDKTKLVPIWNKREYLAAQNQASFHLPNLHTQVQQNKAELQSRLNVSRKVNNEAKNNQSPTVTLSTNQKPAEDRSSNESLSTGDSSVAPENFPKPKNDPLGTIMKELLPSKPGKLMTDQPKNNDFLYRNGAAFSDNDSGVSMCTPIKVFRPKIRSPHDAPAPSDIIKKFSAKPKAHSGPMKADHTVLPENVLLDRTQIVNVGESSEKIFLKKSSINYNEKIQQRPTTARVHFEDESEHEAELRHQERRLLERTHTTKIRSDILPKPQVKSLERIKTLEPVETSASPSTAERSAGQKTANLPYRRQPFPPNVAKKVLIDIPRSGLPSRRPVQMRTSQAMKDKQLSSCTGKEANSLDGITMSFTSTSQEWKEQSPSTSESKEENKSNHSFSSLETIGSGITEVSSEVTITTLEWRGSGSSIGTESHTRPSSQNQTLNLNHPPLGGEVSFYSRVKKSLQVKMKMSPDTRMMNDTYQSERDYSDSSSQHSKSMDQGSDASLELDRREKVASHGKSNPHGATSPRQVIMRENESSNISQDRMKMDAEAQNKDRDIPMKAPFLSMRMMQSLLKKGRAKNYMVHVPSPPSLESRPPSGRPTISGSRVNKVKKDQVTERASARVLAVQSDSSRLVELRRPKTGFSGLYLAQRIKNHSTGLFVVQLSGAFTSSFPQGVLELGDEILEINRRQAKDLSMEEIQSLLEESSCVLLRVLPLAHGL